MNLHEIKLDLSYADFFSIFYEALKYYNIKKC